MGIVKLVIWTEILLQHIEIRPLKTPSHKVLLFTILNYFYFLLLSYHAVIFFSK